MAYTQALVVVLSTVALAAAPVLAQNAPAPQGYVAPEDTGVGPAPQTPQEQETLRISAPRYHRLHEARIPGSPNRGNPMRQFPGELPEKNAISTPFDLEGIVLEDARQSQALPMIQGRVATPDPLNP